jgi:hypothetical protein
MASITASIQDQNFLQAWMITSLSRSVITSEVMTFREARVIWKHLLTSLSTSHNMKNQKDCTIVSWEARYPSTSGFFSVGLQPVWEILAVSAREAFSIAAEVSHPAHIFCSLLMVVLYYVIQEMGIFPMSVANNFCDMRCLNILTQKLS